MVKRSIAILFLFGGLLTFSGPPISSLTPIAIWDSLLHIEQAPGLSQYQKLALVIPLREAFEKAGYSRDSVYARLLHRIAVFQYYTTKAYDSCIANNLEAIRINTSGRKGACLSFAVGSYRNMGYYYKGLSIYDQALAYFDSSIQLANRFPGQEAAVKTCRQERSNIFALKGDYERSIEEATLGILLGQDTHDTAYSINMLTQRALAETKAGDIAAATGDAELDRQLAIFTKDTVVLAGSFGIKALIDATTGHTEEALREYREAIRLQVTRPVSIELADYYLDQGILLMEKMNRLAEAETSYRKAYGLAQQLHNPIEAASACIDLDALHYNKKDYREAILDLHQALQQLRITPAKDILRNPAFSALVAQQNKSLLVLTFGNKTSDLLAFCKSTQDPLVLTACLHTALLADSLVTALRQEQTDEPSKLVWRTATREFYSNALEACWLAHDANAAFFFMEKSRAVLLNDRLNELGASAFLPPDELARQQQLQLRLIQQERHLADLPDSSSDYRQEELAFLQAKDSLERYTRSLEQTAPAYYQYKYADAVPTLGSLQHLLAAGDRRFVHYFVNDSVIYMLGITPSDTRMIRIPYFNLGREINSFMRLCADRQAENGDFPAFGRLAHHLYGILLEPLGWTAGRVFVSPDNFFIPFEALAADSLGSHFLINDFSFDYVYSARYLLEPSRGQPGEASFLGVAPAFFAPGLDVPDLPQSLDACREAAACYPSADVLTERRATKKEFLQKAAHYSVVTVYAHARSDSVQKEPLLFLADSVIRLSELPLLQRPAAQLVVLSACQTNAGRNAEGEGIYSLARGFAAAGIPAVAATLWQADEESIYAITAAFHKRLAQGMDKDLALRESKLEFIRGGDRSRSLPYYWANMILVGNPQALVLPRGGRFQLWWLAGLAVVVVGAFSFWVKVRRRSG
ncbi:MAG TPA: CHAT domain-containing protein [Puia sp.]|nr:CHAT domain-containing protein [Puia sp.]